MLTLGRGWTKVEFGILGPLEVRRDGRLLPLGGAKERSLLALLLLEANRVVGADRLVELLWAGEPPATAINLLQQYVSHLPHALEPERTPRGTAAVPVNQSSGYRLVLGPDPLDLDRFDRLADQADPRLDHGPSP